MSSNRKRKGGRNHRAHAPEVKAAVLAALLAGQGVEAVAAQYRLPVGTVKSWKSKMRGESPVVFTDDQQADVSRLLLDYLRESLATLIHQQRTVFRDLKWLKQQSAAELATLHGVLTDKVARLTQAMSGPPPDGPEAPVA